MVAKTSTLGFEQTLMYGQYREDLGEYAKRQAKKLNRVRKSEEKILAQKVLKKSVWKRHITGYLSFIWKKTFARIGEDWVFLALLGVIMALLSFIMDYCIHVCSKTRIWLYDDLTGDNIWIKFIAWVTMPVLLILFSSGFVHIVSPQAVGSGIPEMKTILRGVILNEYLTFRTLVAKMIGLTSTLGSGLPLGKEGPFVHVASIVATLLSKLITSFKGIYENESRTGEMLAAACAVGVASTFYAPIGGVLFSIEVTSVFFAVRNYWRGFFAACCAASVWRLLEVWSKDEEAITALFKTHFRADFPFDPQELFVFSLIGVACGFGGAAYVTLHRKVVNFFRTRKSLSNFLQKNRFLYPGLVTLLLTSISFPQFLGQYMATQLSTHDSIQEMFSNITWGHNHSDPVRLKMVYHWSTPQTSIYFNLSFYIIMTFWMSILASTIPVPSGTFIPVFKIGAAFGRLVGEFMAYLFPMGISFGGSRNPIVPGGYAVVGAAAFSGAVTHTISTSVIVFELTGQMTHIIPVIIAVLIANAISQTLELSIYDSIIEIKKLPFLPPILSTSSAAHHIYVKDIMVRDVACIWRNCTYRDIKNLLRDHRKLQSFPLVEDSDNMILLGSVQRRSLSHLASQRLSRDRRLQEVRRRYSIQDTLMMAAEKAAAAATQSQVNNNNDGGQYQQQPSPNNTNNKAPLIPKDSNTPAVRRMSRFEVTPVHQPLTAGGGGGGGTGTATSAAGNRPSPRQPVKSILKHTVSFTYSPHSTVTYTTAQDSRLRHAFENIFLKSLKLQDANPDKSENSDNKPQRPVPSHNLHRRVQLPRERVIDMSQEEQAVWEEEQLNSMVDFSTCQIDPAPFQLVEKTTLLKVYSIFSMLGLTHAYVTSIGRLVGVVALKDLRIAIEQMNQGILVPVPNQSVQITDPTGIIINGNGLRSSESDIHYEDTITSVATNDSEFTTSRDRDRDGGKSVRDKEEMETHTV
ncbi:chloride channel protein 2-like [Oppia nitens]|uniref:chloride channel protein 2-like n=1 Tax=Oppia nitens TaxID=1686743 RepID=UPI0023DCA93E|nr:chloride channel protein 2-like [Oppia nitens]